MRLLFVGERMNVIGLCKFKCLVVEGKFEEVVEVVRV